MINKTQTEIKEKMIEVVIEISEGNYNNLMLYKDYPYGRNYAEQAIIKGTLLPENHGRIIDEATIPYENECVWESDGCCTTKSIPEIDKAPTILKAKDGDE